MASAALHAVIDQLRASPIPADAPLAVLREVFPETLAPEGTLVTGVDAGGVRGEWVVADNAVPDRQFLYLHGGGYVINGPATHRDLAGRLSRAAQMAVIVLDYRPAPSPGTPLPCSSRRCPGRVGMDRPQEPNSDVLLKVPPGQSLAHHWHTSAERMVLISRELEVAYDAQQPATLKPGMYAYGPAKLPHSAACQSADPRVLFIAFEGPIDAVPAESSKPQASAAQQLVPRDDGVVASRHYRCA